MKKLHRRTVIAGLGAGLAILARPGLAALPPDQAEIVDRIEGYLNGVRTLEARFEQLGPDGGLATGKVYLQRPGRLRFDYDPPSKILMIASDWRLIFQDASIQQVNVIPLRETPLGFLLAERIDLSRDVEVTRAAESTNELAIEVVRKDARDQGSLVVVFGKGPVELRRWTVTDAQGLQTELALNGLQTNVSLKRNLFVWRDPQVFGWPEN
jgi:outer membrane lipoprotein-sorting protein